jgi:hypothetical protein
VRIAQAGGAPAPVEHPADLSQETIKRASIAGRTSILTPKTAPCFGFFGLARSFFAAPPGRRQSEQDQGDANAGQHP